MIHKETVRLDEVMLGNSPEMTVGYNKEDGGVVITSVTFGSTSIMEHLDEITLEVLTEEIYYGTLQSL